MTEKYVLKDLKKWLEHRVEHAKKLIVAADERGRTDEKRYWEGGFSAFQNAIDQIKELEELD